MELRCTVCGKEPGYIRVEIIDEDEVLLDKETICTRCMKLTWTFRNEAIEMVSLSQGK